MAGSVVAAILIVALVVPGYMVGSWRWLRHTRSLFEVAAFLVVFLFLWFAILKIVGGSQVLVPIALLVLIGSFAAGRIGYLRRARSS